MLFPCTRNVAPQDPKVLILLQPPPPLVKTVWEERPSSRQSGKTGQSLGSAMTKVGGTTKKNKAKSPSRVQLQNADVSASWTSLDSGIEVWSFKRIFEWLCLTLCEKHEACATGNE